LEDSMSNVVIFESDKWVEGVTVQIVSRLRAALGVHKRASILLAGGGTPAPVYRALAQNKVMNWQQVHFFWGDERHVPPDDAQSNFRMVRETLLEPLGLPSDAPNVHRFPTDTSPDEDAAQYEQTIKGFFGLAEGEMPRFDVVLLGMGGDGHTASLFPGTEALSEEKRIAVANPVPAMNTTRLTLTYPALNNAHAIFMLLKGAGKAALLSEVLTGEPGKYPIQDINPTKGELSWLVDTAAASQLPPR
jgi:6-phosphogluconolactonase